MILIHQPRFFLGKRKSAKQFSSQKTNPHPKLRCAHFSVSWISCASKSTISVRVGLAFLQQTYPRVPAWDMLRKLTSHAWKMCAITEPGCRHHDRSSTKMQGFTGSKKCYDFYDTKTAREHEDGTTNWWGRWRFLFQWHFDDSNCYYLFLRGGVLLSNLQHVVFWSHSNVRYIILSQNSATPKTFFRTWFPTKSVSFPEDLGRSSIFETLLWLVVAVLITVTQ